jgi:hypothetical protein
MEGMMPNSAYLKNLRCQVKKLTAAVLPLSNMFAEEAVHLSCRDEASRLRELHFSIGQQLDRAKSSEDTASYGYSKANLIVSLGGLAIGGTIKMLSQNKGLQAFSDHLLNSLGGEKRPFGRVLICVGPRGMPDDVQVVSISRLARESKREESEVIDELQRHGCLLFSEKAFSLLIDKLACDVQEGRLRSPVCREKLIEIGPQASIRLIPKTQNKRQLSGEFTPSVFALVLSSALCGFAWIAFPACQ